MGAKKKSSKPASASGRKAKSAAQAAASPSPETTKQALMDAAVGLFADRGFDATTVKDISDKAGVNVSLVSYHFDGKEGLYRACMMQFGSHRLEAAQRILQPATTLEECRVRVEMFIEDMVIWWVEQPKLCRIIQRESHLNFPVAKEVFENTFLKVFELFASFIKAGQQKKFLRADVDVHLVAGVIFGGLTSVMEKDELGARYFGSTVKDPAFRKKLKTQVSMLFLQGIQA
jgi:AcrR family transcriptional regulator